ncbi:MBL fold metallo-hydrolase [Clostridium oryzae]|uniref:Hydroxyacylglutathione hydrolase n=1 Tax=Clostridium oryzae TaxID=1450648 RepID=A0A1V4IBK0_9CLOT|nr:MBL fold metallo-hydrolase [Clostridium oryzae]OPJ57378.1 hydroxyacylglutathione hydrolase [Clostridium oryzae]
MELTKINGNTYYINAPTNIGIYSYKNKNCMLIDTGKNNTAARKIEQVILENGLHPKYIVNTHSHTDHCGGNNYFKNTYTGCITYTSSREKLYMESIQMFPTMIYTCLPPKQLEEDCKDVQVDFILEYGMNKINDEKFTVLDVRGHSTEHIAILTPDRVCFLGDSIFSDYTLDKYPFPLLFNIQYQFDTLESIKDIDADYFVISHSDGVINKQQLEKLIVRNTENIHRYLDDIVELLEKPLTKEDLLENIVILNDIKMDYREYYLNMSSLSAFLAYLQDNGKIKNSLENGKMYYYV